MEYNDENHITKTALEFYANICKSRDHPRLERKCLEMAGNITCDPKTKCTHNAILD